MEEEEHKILIVHKVVRTLRTKFAKGIVRGLSNEVEVIMLDKSSVGRRFWPAIRP
jgi:hypothetical protein